MLEGTVGADVPPELVEEEEAADSLDPSCEVPLWHGGDIGGCSKEPKQRTKCYNTIPMDLKDIITRRIK